MNALHVAGWHKQKNGKLSLTYNLQAAACSAPLLPPSPLKPLCGWWVCFKNARHTPSFFLILTQDHDNT
jgi:hypothetical protein